MANAQLENSSKSFLSLIRSNIKKASRSLHLDLIEKLFLCSLKSRLMRLFLSLLNFQSLNAKTLAY